ncbi:MAG: hypothetical protein CL878_00390 [Dehalococcoidia bacterium]|nr:hypothetical protein [Dehalococcoidia bacterium]
MAEEYGPRFSVVILTLDEAAHLPACLQSVAWADEVIVLDSGSTDATRKLARAAGARIHVHPLRNFAHQRNIGLALARGDWVLMVDADERVTTRLRREVGEVAGAPDNVVGYHIPRQNRIFGRWVRHTGWHPDHQLRLLRRGYAWWEGPVHEAPRLDGGVGWLTSPLIHENYETVQEFFGKLDSWSELAMQESHFQLRGTDSGLLTEEAVAMMQQPIEEFVRRFVKGEGYRDYLLGLTLALLQSMYPALVAAKRWERSTRAEQRTWEHSGLSERAGAAFLTQVATVLAHGGVFAGEHFVTAILVHNSALARRDRVALRGLLRLLRLGKRLLPSQGPAMKT